MDDPGFEPRQGQKIFLFSKASTPGLVQVQLPSQGLPRIRWPGPDADNSPPPSPEIKNEWSSTSTPPIHFYEMRKDSFTSLLAELSQNNKGHTYLLVHYLSL